MIEIIPSIRNCVRAVIHRDDKILLLHKIYEDDTESFVLPGGAQDLSESLEDALQRECIEEINTNVEILDLLCIADYFKPRQTEPATYRQQVEFVFLCKLPVTYEAQNGPHPDKHQHSVTWVELKDLPSISFTPQGLVKTLYQNSSQAGSVYLGEIQHE